MSNTPWPLQAITDKSVRDMIDEGWNELASVVNAKANEKTKAETDEEVKEPDPPPAVAAKAIEQNEVCPLCGQLFQPGVRHGVGAC